MDRFITQMAKKAVLSPTKAAASQKRVADIDMVDGDDIADKSPKKAKTASDDNNSLLPHFPRHSVAWQPAAQSFFDSLPDSHRSPFISLVNDIFDSNNQLLSSPTTSSSLATDSLPAPPPPPPPAMPSFDPSTVLSTYVDVSFVQPRGKFDVHVTDNAFILTSSGKQPSTTFLPYTSLGQLAAVPDVNRKDWCVLLQLRPTAAPLVVGKTSLSQVLLKVDTTRKTTDAKAIRLPQQPAHSQPLPTVTIAAHFLSTLRKYCSTLPLVTPEPATFSSTASTASISCYYGTNDGQLYPLSAGLLFLQRPVVWVALETVDGIEVKRSGGGKTFDLKVGVTRSGEKDEVVVFGMISVKEQQALEYYVQYVAKWQKKREREQKASAALDSTAASFGGGATSIAQPVDASADRGDAHDDSDSEADSDFDPDGSGDEEGGDNASGDDSAGDGAGSDSDDSQFNSDIDVEAEVSAEDILNQCKRTTRTAQTVQPAHRQPSEREDSLDSEESEDEQHSETGDGAEQLVDEEMTSSSSEVDDVQQKQHKQDEDGSGDMSRFRNVAAADTSKEELTHSGSSAEEDDVITIE